LRFVGLKDTWIQRETRSINNCDCLWVWYWSQSRQQNCVKLKMYEVVHLVG
jgi:hypothetical protein